MPKKFREFPKTTQWNPTRNLGYLESYKRFTKLNQSVVVESEISSKETWSSSSYKKDTQINIDIKRIIKNILY